MTRLLNANFARLFKGKLFWLCAAVSFVFALVEVFSSATFPLSNGVMSAEKPLFNASGFFFLILAAVFSGIFVGTEHGGALRNKIIVGQKRINIFLASSITCSAAVAIFQFLFAVTILLSGLVLGRKFSFSFGETALYELLQLVSLVEASVLCSAISLLIPRKFGGALASLLVLMVLFALNFTLSTYSRYSQEGIFDGTPMTRVEKQNLSDKEKTLIAFCEGFQDINPIGQQKQIKESYFNKLYYPSFLEYQKISADDWDYTEIHIPAEIALFALGTIAVSTIVGTLVFRKKDLR